MKQLRQEAAGARSCVPAAMEWLLAAELTPPSPDRHVEDRGVPMRDGFSDLRNRRSFSLKQLDESERCQMGQDRSAKAACSRHRVQRSIMSEGRNSDLKANDHAWCFIVAFLLIGSISATVCTGDDSEHHGHPRALLRESLLSLSDSWSDGAIDSVVDVVASLAKAHRGELTEKDAARIAEGLRRLPNFHAITPDTHPLVTRLIRAQLRYSVERYLTHWQPNEKNRQAYVLQQTRLIEEWAQQARTLAPNYAHVIDAGKTKAIEAVTLAAANVLTDEGREALPPELLARVRKEWSNDSILAAFKSSNDPDVSAAHVSTILQRGLNRLRKHSLGKAESPPEYYRFAKSAYNAAIPEIREWCDRKGVEAMHRIQKQQQFRDEVQTPAEGAVIEQVSRALDLLEGQFPLAQEPSPLRVGQARSFVQAPQELDEALIERQHNRSTSAGARVSPVGVVLAVIGGMVLLTGAVWWCCRLKMARRRSV